MPTTTDLWGVWRDLDRIRSNTGHPLFATFWQSTLSSLKSALASRLTTDGTGAARVRSVSETMQSHAFAYPLTGDDRHAQRALEALEMIRTEPCEWNFIEHNEMYPQDTADLMTAEITKSCANTVSWLWPILTETQRATYITMIATRGGEPIYSGATAGCWWGNALNSNWTAVLNSGLAFAALSADQDDWLPFARARTMYFGLSFPGGMNDHLRPVEKPAPPRPWRPDAFTSSTTSAGLRSRSAARAAS
jgi:hypothetical protein